jgi:hypothetical protein
MRRHAFLFCVALLSLFIAGCSNDNSTAPVQSGASDLSQGITLNPEAIAAELVDRAGWEIDPTAAEIGPALPAPGSGCITWYERDVIVDDIVHYSFQIPVGSGPFDVIGLHRVVRESHPEKPIRTRKAIFLQHGDLIGFSKFLFGSNSPSTFDDHSVAVYLAKNNVDVWGIDQNWTMIPKETTDFSFMADWDLQNQVDNLATGVTVARLSRLATGNGWRKMHLLGYSSGVWTGYALLNQETQLPTGHRQIAGYVPVEGAFKTNVESDRLRSCALAAAYGDSLDAGTYQDATAQLWGFAAMLARVDPDGASPILPGFTNLQAVLVAGAATYMVGGMDCCYHFVGGIFNEFGIPTGLQFTPVDGFIDFLSLGGGYMPYAWHQETEALQCDEIDLPYDDHIGDISVPILYIGAGGGLGEKGLYHLGLLGSTDVTSTVVQLYPPEASVLDFGHTDLWSAADAAGLVWAPILDWIDAHTPGNGEDTRFEK